MPARKDNNILAKSELHALLDGVEQIASGVHSARASLLKSNLVQADRTLLDVATTLDHLTQEVLPKRPKESRE